MDNELIVWQGTVLHFDKTFIWCCGWHITCSSKCIVKSYWCICVPGKEWEHFAWSEASSWFQRYQLYLDSNIPLLIIKYDELNDPNQVQRKLLLISHFLRVPVDNDVLLCLTERANDYTDLKPRTLKHGFQPFELLSAELVQHLNNLENSTIHRVNQVIRDYLPYVHATWYHEPVRCLLPTENVKYQIIYQAIPSVVFVKCLEKVWGLFCCMELHIKAWIVVQCTSKVHSA